MHGGPSRRGISFRGGPRKVFEEAPMSAASPTRLSYDVFVSDGPAGAGDERMPDGAPLAWSPLSSPLISGTRDAVLVDPPFTRMQIERVGDWVERSGRRRAHIYPPPPDRAPPVLTREPAPPFPPPTRSPP